MSSTKDPFLKLVKPFDESAHRCGNALADMYKAMKAISFYPKGHPLRNETQKHAYSTLLSVMNGEELFLVITRNGFTSNNGGAPIEPNPMVQALAKELFIRRIQRLTLLADLTLRDLRLFLRLLTLEPQKIQSSGGIESMMSKQAIASIWTNEIDLSVILEKRQSMEQEKGADSLEAGEEDDDPLAGLAETALAMALPQQEQTELSFASMLLALDQERDDNAYLKLAGVVAAKADELKENGEFNELFSAIELLQLHGNDETRSSVQREYALFTFEQLTSGKMTDFILDQLTDRDCKEQEHYYAILHQLGTKVAYVIIQRLCVADGLFARKALATALIKIGPAAIPALLTMLQDDRWYVVRNIVAILGEISHRSSLSELKKTSMHRDERVRKETIRTLVKIGGKDAEAIIIALLKDKDPGIVQQAVLSLGIMKSQLAVQPLIDIIAERDLFLGTIALKLEALQAIGRIGDRRATPHLLGLLTSTHWLAWGKGEELKVYAAIALGQLGDESALGALNERAARGGRLGRSCAEAVDNIERLAEATYD